MTLTILQQDIDKAIAWEKGNRHNTWTHSCPIANAAKRQFKAHDTWLAERLLHVASENGVLTYITDDVGFKVEKTANKESSWVLPCEINLKPEASDA